MVSPTDKTIPTEPKEICAIDIQSASVEYPLSKRNCSPERHSKTHMKMPTNKKQHHGGNKIGRFTQKKEIKLAQEKRSQLTLPFNTQPIDSSTTILFLSSCWCVYFAYISYKLEKCIWFSTHFLCVCSRRPLLLLKFFTWFPLVNKYTRRSFHQTRTHTHTQNHIPPVQCLFVWIFV